MRYLLLALPLVFAACQSEPAEPTSDLQPAIEDTEAPVVAAAPGAKLNLNTATEDDFKALGIGDRMAHEFDEYRPYASIREFRRQIGKYINDDADQLAEYETMVFVPVDPNASDAETMRQLPGLDQAAAEALVADRPYADDDAFLARYADIASGADRDAASTYLDR